MALSAVAIESMTKHVDVGRCLTQQAISQRADLLVMGCYGHSRLRELVLGGASRHQLAAHADPRVDVALTTSPSGPFDLLMWIKGIWPPL